MSGEAQKQKKKLRHPVLFFTLVATVLFAIGAERSVVFQMKRYEKGLIDVCATQQDAYVQLVLDQINLKDNRDDEEIITEILGTLDASSNKYWTFSRSQAMLFVKDVLETNKYKGFTTATYYGSASARTFLEGLQLNRVTHSEIEISGVNYIASGVVFQYGGEDYRLCLLTNRSVLLDNNTFLGAKVSLLTILACIMLLLVLVPLIFARHMREMLFEMDEKENSIRELNRRMEMLNKRLSERDLHDTRYNIWQEDAIGGFLGKLSERGVGEVSALEVCCADAASRETFLANAHYSLDKSVLRFAFGENDLLLVFVQTGQDEVMLSVIPLLSQNARIGRKYIAEEEGGFDEKRLRERFGIKE